MRAPPPPEPKAKRETNLNATARGRGEVPAALFSQLLQEVHPQPGGDHLLVLAAPSDRQVPHCQPQGVCPPQKSPAAEGQAGTDRGKIDPSYICLYFLLVCLLVCNIHHFLYRHSLRAQHIVSDQVKNKMCFCF